MSTTPGQDELINTLKRYTSFLEERNRALDALLSTSERMRLSLRQDQTPDIDPLLRQRERDCDQLAGVAAKENKTDAIAFESVRQCADSAGGELGSLAQSAVNLLRHYEAAAQSVLLCQNECESIFRERLQATTAALQASVQRRKMDAAYGVARRDDRPPRFLDKRR